MLHVTLYILQLGVSAAVFMNTIFKHEFVIYPNMNLCVFGVFILMENQNWIELYYIQQSAYQPAAVLVCGFCDPFIFPYQTYNIIIWKFCKKNYQIKSFL